MTHKTLELRVLVFPEGDAWVAQVLEKDMAAHGPSIYAALAAVELVIQAHVNFDTRQRREPFSTLGPAPKQYWQAFDRAEPLKLPKSPQFAMPAHIAAALTQDPLSLTM